VPHSIYLFEDLALEAFPRHRVYYFPNLFRVDAARLELLRERVLGHGAVVVWGPGSGISDGQRIGVESASRLTGFAFDRIDANAPRRVLISDFDHPVTRDLGAGTILGGPLAYGPVLLPVDGRELGLAWTKGGFNHAGLALMEHGRGAARTPEGVPERGPGDYAAVFSTVVNLPAGLWRGLARFAGAHVYCETDDVLLASAGIVALHSLKSEAKRLALPGEHRVHDVIADRVWSHRTREIRFALHAPETRVFRLEG
jgi:hypothetical protein